MWILVVIVLSGPMDTKAMVKNEVFDSRDSCVEMLKSEIPLYQSWQVPYVPTCIEVPQPT